MTVYWRREREGRKEGGKVEINEMKGKEKKDIVKKRIKKIKKQMITVYRRREGRKEGRKDEINGRRGRKRRTRT